MLGHAAPPILDIRGLLRRSSGFLSSKRVEVLVPKLQTRNPHSQGVSVERGNASCGSTSGSESSGRQDLDTVSEKSVLEF
jgi:hypothetical protein